MFLHSTHSQESQYTESYSESCADWMETADESLLLLVATRFPSGASESLLLLVASKFPSGASDSLLLLVATRFPSGASESLLLLVASKFPSGVSDSLLLLVATRFPSGAPFNGSVSQLMVVTIVYEGSIKGCIGNTHRP